MIEIKKVRNSERVKMSYKKLRNNVPVVWTSNRSQAKHSSGKVSKHSLVIKHQNLQKKFKEKK